LFINDCSSLLILFVTFHVSYLCKRTYLILLPKFSPYSQYQQHQAICYKNINTLDCYKIVTRMWSVPVKLFKVKPHVEFRF
jgi:hypothetical protein